MAANLRGEGTRRRVGRLVMGMTFKKNFNFKDIAAEIRDRQKVTLARAMEEAAGEIVKRTQSGRGVEGGGFAKYTPEYAAFKAKSGRKTTPDLTFSGKMLASITSKVEEYPGGLIGRIYFSASQAVKAAANQKLRRFFGLSKKQINEMTEKIRNAK